MPNFKELEKALTNVTPLAQRDIPAKSFGQRDDHPQPGADRSPTDAERKAGVTPLKR